MKSRISQAFAAAVVGSSMLAIGCSAGSDGAVSSSESNLTTPSAVTTLAVAKAQDALNRAQVAYAQLKSHPPLKGTWSGTGAFTRPAQTSIFSWWTGGGYTTHDANFFSFSTTGAGFTAGGKQWKGKWPMGVAQVSGTDVLSVDGTIDSWEVYQSRSPKHFIQTDTSTTLTVDLKQVENPLAYDVAVAVLGAQLNLTIYGLEGMPQYPTEAEHANGVAIIQQDIDDDSLEPSFKDGWGDFERVRDANGCVNRYKVRVKWSVPDNDVSATTVAGATLLTPITTFCN